MTLSLTIEALTTLDTVKDELGISVSTFDETLKRHINAVSARIATYCERIFYYEADIVEAHAGFGMTHMVPKRWPVLSVDSLTFDGADIDSDNYEIQGRMFIYAIYGWAWTAKRARDITRSRLPGTEEQNYELTYTAGYVTPQQVLDEELHTQAPVTYCKVWDDSAAGYANLEDGDAGDFTQWALLPANTEDDDAVYFGGSEAFDKIYLDMSATLQTYTNDATTWEYWNGSAWVALTVADGTDAVGGDGLRSFGQDGHISFTAPVDWAAVAVDSVSIFWIRCVVVTAANISQVGITESKRHEIVTNATRTLPQDLEDACVMAVVGRYLSKGQDLGVKSEKSLTYAITYGGTSRMALSQEVKDMLAPYKAVW